MTEVRRILISIASTAAVAIVVAAYGYRELVARRPHAVDDPYRVWIAALKGFEGKLRYIGEDRCYSYFTTGSDYTPRYKRPTDTTSLPKHFPVGGGTPYSVTSDMVPWIDSASEDGTQNVSLPNG